MKESPGGNIGSYVAASLAERGFLVRVLVQKVTKNTARDRLGVEQIAGDFNDLGSCDRPSRGWRNSFLWSPLAENLVQLEFNSIEAARARAPLPSAFLRDLGGRKRNHHRPLAPRSRKSARALRACLRHFAAQCPHAEFSAFCRVDEKGQGLLSASG